MRNQVTHRHSEKGFTLTEVMIASGIAGLAFALSAVAVMGFRFQGQTTFTQLQTRLRNHNALEKIVRHIMEATKVTVQGAVGEPQIVHLWHDEQEVWTPESTEDDTEGILLLDAGSNELRYRPAISQDEIYAVVAEKIDEVEYWLDGKALFIKMTMTYDPHTAGSEREVLASFVVRNNPKLRLGASN
jgi:prepilin-type N-terminal cleavage/methylation domain-containing protein